VLSFLCYLAVLKLDCLERADVCIHRLYRQCCHDIFLTACMAGQITLEGQVLRYLSKPTSVLRCLEVRVAASLIKWSKREVEVEVRNYNGFRSSARWDDCWACWGCQLGKKIQSESFEKVSKKKRSDSYVCFKRQFRILSTAVKVKSFCVTDINFISPSKISNLKLHCEFPSQIASCKYDIFKQGHKFTS